MANSGKKLLIGCGAIIGAGGVAILAVILAFGVAIETGRMPDTEALPAGQIPARQIKQLKEMGVVKPGEEVLFFYSSAFFSIRSEGNLFTDQRVILYQELDGDLEIHDATYAEIADIEFEPAETWSDDSLITITLNDGMWFVLSVSTESGGDRAFHDKLAALWQRRAR